MLVTHGGRGPSQLQFQRSGITCLGRDVPRRGGQSGPEDGPVLPACEEGVAASAFTRFSAQDARSAPGKASPSERIQPWFLRSVSSEVCLLSQLSHQGSPRSPAALECAVSTCLPSARVTCESGKAAALSAAPLVFWGLTPTLSTRGAGRHLRRLLRPLPLSRPDAAQLCRCLLPKQHFLLGTKPEPAHVHGPGLRTRTGPRETPSPGGPADGSWGGVRRGLPSDLGMPPPCVSAQGLFRLILAESHLLPLRPRSVPFRQMLQRSRGRARASCPGAGSSNTQARQSRHLPLQAGGLESWRCPCGRCASEPQARTETPTADCRAGAGGHSSSGRQTGPGLSLLHLRVETPQQSRCCCQASQSRLQSQGT